MKSCRSSRKIKNSQRSTPLTKRISKTDNFNKFLSSFRKQVWISRNEGEGYHSLNWLLIDYENVVKIDLPHDSPKKKDLYTICINSSAYKDKVETNVATPKCLRPPIIQKTPPFTQTNFMNQDLGQNLNLISQFNMARKSIDL